MARQRMLRLMKDGEPDSRLWHWTAELAKDPNMQEVYTESGTIDVPGNIAKVIRVIYWAKSSDEFGKFDIIKTIEGGDDEVIDTITGKEAAMARADELNSPEGAAEGESKPKELTKAERKAAIEDAISGMSEEDWSKGPVPYPKVPVVSALTGFKVSFQEIKAISDEMKGGNAGE